MNRSFAVTTLLFFLALNGCATTTAISKKAPIGSKIAFIDDSSDKICVDYIGPTIFNNKKYSISLDTVRPSKAEKAFESFAKQSGFEPVILDPASALDIDELPYESHSEWTTDLRITESFMQKTGNRLKESGVKTLVILGGNKRAPWHLEKPDLRCVGISAALSTRDGVHIYPEGLSVFDLETGYFNTVAWDTNRAVWKRESLLDKKQRGIATFQWGEIPSDKVPAVRAFNDELVSEMLYDLLAHRLNPALPF